jgi:hypothetical protein
MPRFDMADDATDFTRAIVRVLDRHPQLRASKVVIVGESYGGARAQLVLDNLLHYANRSGLAAELQAHFDAVFPATAGSTHTATEIAQQFYAQVLIEPVVMGEWQLRVAQTAGPCTDDTTGATCAPPTVVPMLSQAALTARVLGADLTAVPGLAGPNRHGYRLASSSPDPGEAPLHAWLGELDWDDAFLGAGTTSDDWATDLTLVPGAFLGNLATVRTLITHATYDANVNSDAIVTGMVADGTPATIDVMPRAGVARPGWIDVALPHAHITIRYPTYQAGHQVTRTTPGQLRDDVADWLQL